MQGQEVAAVPETYKEAFEASDLDGGEEEEESPEMQLKCLAVAKASLERRGVLTEACLKAIRDCQRELRLEKQQKLRQTTILDHFRKR